MWIFGHLGFGSKLAQPFARRLPFGWLLFGTLLPDLIDKPLYYIPALLSGKRGFDLGLVSCTRTFGHTAILTLAIATFAFVRKSRIAAAIALGAATHLAIDGFQDYWFHAFEGNDGESSAFVALSFPFYLSRFSEMPFASVGDHLKTGGRPFQIVTEGIGLVILLLAVRKERRRVRLAAGRNGSASRKSKAAR